MNRRGFITGLVGLIAAPAIVRAASLMPVSVPRLVTAPSRPFLTGQMITRETLTLLENNLVATRRFNSLFTDRWHRAGVAGSVQDSTCCADS